MPLYPHCAATWEGGVPAKPYSALPMFARTRAEAPELWDSACPAKQLSPEDTPLLILHGTANTTTPVEQSVYLNAAAQKAGVPSGLVIAEGAPHSFHLQPKQHDLRDLVLGFLTGSWDRLPAADRPTRLAHLASRRRGRSSHESEGVPTSRFHPAAGVSSGHLTSGGPYSQKSS